MGKWLRKNAGGADHLGCDPGIARVRDEGFAEFSTICVIDQCGFTATWAE